MFRDVYMGVINQSILELTNISTPFILYPDSIDDLGNEWLHGQTPFSEPTNTSRYLT